MDFCYILFYFGIGEIKIIGNVLSKNYTIGVIYKFVLFYGVSMEVEWISFSKQD